MRVGFVVWATIMVSAQTSAQSSAVGSSEFGRRGPGFFFIPSFQVAEIYDDNILFRETNRIASYYTIYSPRLQLLYEGGRLFLHAGGSLEAQVFPSDLDEFSQPSARRRVDVGFRYQSSVRSTLSADASYISTIWPGELIEETGIELGRRRSDGYTSLVSFSRRLNLRQTLDLSYRFRYTDFAPDGDVALGLRTSSHLLGVGWNYQWSRRNTATIQYGFSVYSDDQLSSLLDRREGSQGHALTFGLERALARGLTMSIRGGPRLTSQLVAGPGDPTVELGSGRFVTAEVLAEVEYRRRGGDFSVRYRRTQNPAFGLNGFVDTDSVTARLNRPFGQRLGFRAQVGAFRNVFGEATFFSYRANLGLGLELAEWFFFNLDYRYSQQESFFLPGDDVVPSALRTRSRNLFTASITVGYPLRVN